MLKSLDPRVDVLAEQTKVVHYGPSRLTYQTNTADSYSANSASFTINTPSPQTITDRLFLVRTYLNIQTDADMILGSHDGLRQLPMNSVLETITATINGSSLSDNTAEKLHAMLCYGLTREDQNKTFSMTPCSGDAYQNYNDWTTYGSARNPLCYWGERSDIPPRGGFAVSVVGPREINVVITEPILLSPFYSGMGRVEEGFVNVNQFNVNLRWRSDLGRVFCHSSGGNAITTVTTTFSSAPEILTLFMTPDMTQSLPSIQVLNFHKPQSYIKSVGSLTNNEVKTVFSDTIKLNQIPRKMYLFCKRSRSTETFLTSDAFASIQGVNITWNNQSGLLSNATQQSLYEINRRNGSNQDWTEWSAQRCGPLCIEFGRDIGLMEGESPGLAGSAYTIQVEMRVKNINGSTVDYEFYTVFLLEGSYSISENFATSSLGDLTPQQVLDTVNSEHVERHDLDALQGGSFYSSLKSLVKRGRRLATKSAPVLSALGDAGVPYAGALGKAAKTVGSGRGVGGSRVRRR